MLRSSMFQLEFSFANLTALQKSPLLANAVQGVL